MFSAADLLVWPDLLCVSVTVLFGWGVNLDPVRDDDGPDQFLDRYAAVLGFVRQEFEVLVAEGEHEFCQRVT